MRHVHANRLQGVDNAWLTPDQAKAFCPTAGRRCGEIRYRGAGRRRLQRQGRGWRATMRSPGATPGPPAAAGGRYHPELRGDRHHTRRGGRGFSGVDTDPRPDRRRRAWPWWRPGHTSVVMAMAGVRMPLESFPLQALVSEPVKPVTALRGDVEHRSTPIRVAVRQGRAGDRRGDMDAYTSYSQSGGHAHRVPTAVAAVCELFPSVPAAAHAAQAGAGLSTRRRTARRSSA